MSSKANNLPLSKLMEILYYPAKSDKGIAYPNVEAFCQEEVVKEHWKHAAVDQGGIDAFITFWR